MQDLRSFLASAEKAGELLRVDRETDPLTEMGVLFGETEQPLIFENVRGYPGWQICGRASNESCGPGRGIADRTFPGCARARAENAIGCFTGSKRKHGTC